MGAKKIKVRKKDSEKAAEFLTMPEKMVDWARERLPLVLGVAGGMVVVALVVWAVKIYGASKETKALSAYVTALEGWNLEQGTPSGKAAEQIRAKLATVVDKHRGTRIALDASLDLARLDYAAGRYDEAASWYQRVIEKGSEIPGLTLLARYGLALTWEGKGRNSEALKAWESFGDKVPDPLMREVLWHRARLEKSLGHEEKAVKLLERALQHQGYYPDDAFLKTAITSTGGTSPKAAKG